MGFFDAFRTDGFPTNYPPNKTAVTADVLEAGLLYAICILALSFLLIIPGVRHKQKIFFTVRMVVGLFILAAIMLCNFGQEWEIAHIHTKTAYKSGLRGEVKADVGVKIGLRSVNITLKGTPVNQVNETINYNERFHWSYPWGQGRNAFGPFAGRVNREFREAQYKGLPYPILWIAEYFTLDGEGIRWGRHYRHAGFYTHIMCWLAFPIYMITLALFYMVFHYAGRFLALTGLILLTGNVIYATLRNVNELIIPFTAENRLVFSWGWCFWLNLFNGLLCVILGIVIIILAELKPTILSKFFGIDIATNLEENLQGGEPLTPQDRRFTDANELDRTIAGKVAVTDRPDGANAGTSGDSEQEEYVNAQDIKRRFRKRTTVRGALFAKKSSGKVPRKPVPIPRAQYQQGPSKSLESTPEDDDAEDYENPPQMQTRYRADAEEVDIEMGHPNI